MKDDPAEVVERFIDAWNGGDVDEMLAFIDRGMTIDWSESKAPWAGVFQGHDGARELYAELRHSFDATWGEVHEYVAAGQQVAVPNTAHMRGRDGIEVTARSTIVFTVDGGKVVAAKLFQEHADALRAIGA